MSVVFGIAMAALALAPLLCFASAGPGWQRAGSATSATGASLLVIVGVAAALGGSHPVVGLGDWLGFGPSELRADGLSGIFLALAGITGGAVSLAYFELPAGRWLTLLGCTLLLFVAIAIGSDNGFLFLLAWEAITVCVYLIASAGSEREDLVAGYLTGGLAKVGGGALLVAVGLLYAHTHSFSLDLWAHTPLSAGARGVLFALFLTCFATKVGVVPLHGGLPAGYGSAPRLGAASLSVALCAGFYGLWRFEFDVLGPLPTWCGDALLIIGSATALIGVTYALTRDSLRQFLGFSTVEQTGVAIVGFGVALLGHAAHKPMLAAVGLLAATLQVCAHGLAKTLALIVVDRVELAVGRRTLDPLGGLARALPLSTAAMGVSSLTLAAIPPLGGAVSEWFTFEALLQGFRMPTLLSRLLCASAGAALALTAGLGLLAFAKYFGFMFLGAERSCWDRVHEPSRRSVAVGALAIIVLGLGAVAPWEIQGIGAGLRTSLGLELAHTTISYPLVLGPVFPKFSVLAPTWLYLVLPGYAGLAWLISLIAGRRRTARREPVWVTGSGADLAAVQYRPSAYSNPMRVILRGPLGYHSRLVHVDSASAMPYTLDRRVVLVADRFFYHPIAVAALKVTRVVRSSQSGSLSAYLLYMLVALIVALSMVPILH